MRDFVKFAKNPATMGNAIVIGIGFAFYEIALSVARDVVRPVLEILTGGKKWQDYFYASDGKAYVSLADAEQAGVPTINYGNFLVFSIEFLIILVFLYGIFILLLNGRAYMKALEKQHPQENGLDAVGEEHNKVSKAMNRNSEANVGRGQNPMILVPPYDEKPGKHADEAVKGVTDAKTET